MHNGEIMTAQEDIQTVRLALEPVQDWARTLRWAKERPWRSVTHVHEENGLVVIDLHDLNAALTKKTLAYVSTLAPDLHCGGVVFITGRGRHSVGLPVLNRIVLGTLVRYEREHGWRQRDLGAGRLLMVVDEERIPKRYQGGTPLWVPSFFLVFSVALLWALPLKIGVPLLGIVSWFAWGVWRASARQKNTVIQEE